MVYGGKLGKTVIIDLNNLSPNNTSIPILLDMQFHSDTVNKLCIHHKRKWLISCSSDQTICIIDLTKIDAKNPLLVDPRKKIAFKGGKEIDTKTFIK